MSLAFQKLNGKGTSAYEQLNKLGELIKKVAELNYPDIYKMAKMFAPDVPLVPLVKYWEIPQNRDAGFVDFEGLYFGNFKIHHHSNNVAESNNKYCRSHALIHHGGNIVLKSDIVIHGDDILAWHNNQFEHTGFGTAASMHSDGNTKPYQDLLISFVGFKLGDGEPIPTNKISWKNKTNTYIYIGDLYLEPGEGVISDIPSGTEFEIRCHNEVLNFKINERVIPAGNSEKITVVADMDIEFDFERVEFTLTYVEGEGNLLFGVGTNRGYVQFNKNVGDSPIIYEVFNPEEVTIRNDSNKPVKVVYGEGINKIYAPAEWQTFDVSQIVAYFNNLKLTKLENLPIENPS